MDILISNDDGVHALGIKVLANSLQGLGELYIVAPDRNRSGASNSLTLTRPIRVKKIAERTLSVEGTPTDCVHLAATGLLEKCPDMVVSGINHGANLGDDILYSGTVAAAIEGRYMGLPAMAFSLVEKKAGSKEPDYFETAGFVAAQLVKQLQANPLPADTILSVNVPNIPLQLLKGFEVTRFGTRYQAERAIAQLDPRGEMVYWIGAAGDEQDASPGTDFHAINADRVSITPLHVDMTHYQAFDQLASWVKCL